ncbi:MAG TPA: hypothetical protein GXZ87_06540 [Bacteroidales bacterium]|nr:hypothetical protein [Bacteroidales bacterium]
MEKFESNAELYTYICFGNFTLSEWISFKQIANSDLNAYEKTDAISKVFYGVGDKELRAKYSDAIFETIIEDTKIWTEKEKGLELPYFDVERLASDFGYSYDEFVEMKYKDVFYLLDRKYGQTGRDIQRVFDRWNSLFQ